MLNSTDFEPRVKQSLVVAGPVEEDARPVLGREQRSEQRHKHWPATRYNQREAHSGILPAAA